MCPVQVVVSARLSYTTYRWGLVYPPTRSYVVVYPTYGSSLRSDLAGAILGV